MNKDIELILHKKYEKHRIRGEWFSLTEMQINNIIHSYNFERVSL